MSKLIGLTCTSLLLLLAAKPQENQFAKYKAIETYEIRPGFLIMPSYTADGRVCEIGLQKQNYATDIIHLDSNLDRKDIDQIFDELVPASERGPRINVLPPDSYSISGISGNATDEYENVLIDISARVGSKGSPYFSNVAASIKWKNRKCK